jgi:ribonuclease HI
MVASIFCDGACSGNGTARAVAGWAWAYWPGVATGEPERFRADRLASPATNQRAELMAILEALRWWLSTSSGGGGGLVTVYTDSMYSINCMTKWGPSWRRKGWKRDSGEPLQNLDLIQPLVELWTAEAARRAWRVVHVRGHQTGSSPEAHGNNWVDRAAVAGAQGTIAGITAAPAVATLSKPAPPPRPQTPFPTAATVRQMDIRTWFGFA